MSTATDPLADVVDVAAQLRVVEEALVGLGPELVPERIAKHQLGQVVRSLGRIERAAGGARVVLTKAAADVGVWKAQGFKSAAEWAARENGTTVGQAASDLEASGQLATLPATRDAAASGELSTDAAKAEAAGASADRQAEQDLLGKAKKGDLTGTRQGARKARQRADEHDGKAAERMYRRRQLRTWVEVDGEGRGQWNVPPAYQAVFLAALEPYRQEAFRQARAAGQRPSAEALMADALQLLCLDTLADLDLPVPPAPDGHPPGPKGPDRSGSGSAGAGAGPSGDEADRADRDGTAAAPSRADEPGRAAASGGEAGRSDPDGTAAAPARPDHPGGPSRAGCARPGPDETCEGDGSGRSGGAPRSPDGPERSASDTPRTADGDGGADTSEDPTPPGAPPTGPDRPRPHPAADGGQRPAPDTRPDGEGNQDPVSEPESSLFGWPCGTAGGGETEAPASPVTATAGGAEPDGRSPADRPTTPAPGSGTAPKRHRRAPAQIHFHCDVAAWLRGHPEGDELCEIAGLGPVPMSMVKAFQADAVLKLVLRDGADITAISSHRRYVPAALRTALEARDHECVVPGCHVTRGLQVDHVHDFAKDGPTALWNNAFLCVFHHYLKTHCGWILRGPPGEWAFTPPDTG